VPTLSQGVIEQHLRTKKIKVNDKKALSSLRVVEGDKISLPIELLGAQINVKHADPEFSSSAVTLAKKLLDEYLLFENQYFYSQTIPRRKVCLDRNNDFFSRSCIFFDSSNFKSNHREKGLCRSDPRAGSLLEKKSICIFSINCLALILLVVA
jgi:hypothetical protein